MEEKKFFDFEEGISVGIWDKITYILSFVSLLELIIIIWKKMIGYNQETFEEDMKTNFKFKKSMNMLYSFIEIWVILHTCIAIACSFIVFHILNINNTILLYIIFGYGVLRIFEIIMKQIRVVLFDTIGKKAIPLKSVRRSIILLIHNFIELIFWFSSSTMCTILITLKAHPEIYRVIERLFKLSDKFTWGEFIKSTTLVMTVFTDNYTKVIKWIPQNTLFMDIVFWETLIGFIMIVVSFARFFSVLPGVNVLVEEEKNNS